MTIDDHAPETLSQRERDEIAALAAAAAKIRARRKFLRSTTIALIWAVPVIETLVIAPDAHAQPMGMMTMPPMTMMMGGGMGGGMGMGMM